MGVPVVTQQVKNPTSIHEDVSLIPGLAQWVAVSCGVGRRHGSDLALLCLWRKSAATASIQPLAWELPFAMGVALKKKKREREKITNHKFCLISFFSPSFSAFLSSGCLSLSTIHKPNKLWKIYN